MDDSVAIGAIALNDYFKAAVKSTFVLLASLDLSCSSMRCVWNIVGSF
jgi:hypothetical protein